MASGNLLGDMRDIPDCKAFPIALSCSCGEKYLALWRKYFSLHKFVYGNCR
jgi:hypothetical protein